MKESNLRKINVEESRDEAETKGFFFFNWNIVDLEKFFLKYNHYFTFFREIKKLFYP